MSKAGMEKTVLVVEDHPLFRQGVRSIIDGQRSSLYRVVGEAETAEQALKIVEAQRPDLALIDITLSGDKNGISLVRQLSAAYPEVRTLVVSMHTRIDYVCEAFKAGATGYLSKDSASDELLDAMKKVLNGNEYIDPNLSPSIIHALKNNTPRVDATADQAYSMLSEREQQIFRLLAMGRNPSEVGKELQLSPKTIDNHKTNIFKKLNFNKYFDLYQYARRIGVIDPDF